MKRHVRRQNLSFQSESKDDADSKFTSEGESDFEDMPRKKQRADDSQNNIQEHVTSCFQKAQAVQDELSATSSPIPERAEDCQDPFDKATELLAAIDDVQLEHNDSTDNRSKENSNVISTPRSGTDDIPYSAHTTPDNRRRPQREVVTYDQQEWGIHGIIGKEEIDGVVHYWVDWNPTLVPKYELGKAKL